MTDTPQRMALWELVVVWITFGALWGTGVGWAVGHVRWGAVTGVCSMVLVGGALELLQWYRSR